MIVLKLTGVLLIILSCTYAGFLAALRLKNREKSLAEYEGLILELKNRIIYDGREIAGLISMIFPQDKLMISDKSIEITDQFMLGEDILVCPSVTKGCFERDVVLPCGSWKDDDGTVYEGGQTLRLKSPIEKLLYFTKK